jgi:hypothetical protein
MDDALARFAANFASRSGVTVERLRWFGRYPELCDCGLPDCPGYRMGHQHEEALFENERRG